MLNLENSDIDSLIKVYDYILKLVCTKSKDEIVEYIMLKIENLEKLKETQS